MSEKRQSDNLSRSWFRAERFFEHEGQWYFYTREGSMEGPFSDRFTARERLEAYLKVIRSGMLGIIADGEANWELKPQD